MSEEQLNEIDQTSKGVDFAPWPTSVENDELFLVSVAYACSDYAECPAAGLNMKPPEASARTDIELEARFLSKEKEAIVSFRFKRVRAFRVLDEAGLLELWHASNANPRPAVATFRVRGHGWQAESPAAWLHGLDYYRFSHMVATEIKCLEVVCLAKPIIEIVPAIVGPLG